MCMFIGPGGRVRSQGSIVVRLMVSIWEASLQSRPLMVNVLGDWVFPSLFFFFFFFFFFSFVTHFLSLRILFSSVRLGELLIVVGRQVPWVAITVGLGCHEDACRHDRLL